MSHKDFRAVLALLTISAVSVIGTFAFLVIEFGTVAVLVIAGLFVGLVLLGVASDVRRAFRRAPLDPSPIVPHRRGGWEA